MNKLVNQLGGAGYDQLFFIDEDAVMQGDSAHTLLPWYPELAPGDGSAMPQDAAAGDDGEWTDPGYESRNPVTQRVFSEFDTQDITSLKNGLVGDFLSLLDRAISSEAVEDLLFMPPLKLSRDDPNTPVFEWTGSQYSVAFIFDPSRPFCSIACDVKQLGETIRRTIMLNRESLPRAVSDAVNLVRCLGQ
ncbi:MAG: hypothetical protein IJ228_06225 [Succinivibrio sp.]|nr:hypothetical protein [Succinivibrio sp.]